MKKKLKISMINYLELFIGIIFLALTSFETVDTLRCDRTMGMSLPKLTGSGKFEVLINGGPQKFVPGTINNVRIQGQGDPYGSEKFSKFLLVSEPAIGNAGQLPAGNFRLKDDSLARFSEYCPNAVTHASEVPKSEIQVLWVAPPVSTGCVIFRATVVKNAQQWYMDDDSLTKELCPEDEAHDDGQNLEPCTACEEAKYELTFEGIWSSLTHPRQFPPDLWTAKFSDIIGASHSPEFRLWDYGKVASEGLKHVAESGDPRDLENELKEQSENIRTIIKARGLRHTNYNGLKTFAVFRADRRHNLISFVSKIDPSPDWFVGVSGLNLCIKNGTWLTEKEMNLFPIDAGTDNGASYVSGDTPTLPRAEIQRLVWSSNSESPFYDPDGNLLKPFAKLRLQQQRTYKRGSCDESYSSSGGSNSDYGDGDFRDDSPQKDIPECAMSPWSPWTPCSPSCGQGTSQQFRRYVNEVRARSFGCDRKESNVRPCHNAQSCKGSPIGTNPGSRDDLSPRYGTQDQLNIYNLDNRNPYTTETRNTPTTVGKRNNPHSDEEIGTGDPMDEVCGTTEWRPWSICADPCGTGIRHQTRSFLRPAQAKRHKCEVHALLRKTEQCPRTSECRVPQKVEEGCEVTDWGPWQPCTQTCGKGVKTRDRLYKYPTFDHRKCTLPMQDTAPCDGILPHCPPERTTDNLTSASGTRTRHSRPVGDTSIQYPMGSHGSRQSGTYSGQQTGHHKAQYSSTYPGTNQQQVNNQPSFNDGPSIDCKLSPWSPWSTCSVNCGRGWKYQHRHVEVFNQNGGRPCAHLLERSRSCKGLNCPRNNPAHQTYGGGQNSMEYNYQE